MKIRVVRVRSRDTITGPEVVELIKHAVAATRYPGLEWPMLAAELVRRIGEARLGLFVGMARDGPGAWAPQGLALAILPDSALMMAPQLPLVYSDGKDVLPALYRAVTRWLRDEGYDRMMSCAFRHRPEAWARRFRGQGTFRVVAPLIEVKF